MFRKLVICISKLTSLVQGYNASDYELIYRSPFFDESYFIGNLNDIESKTRKNAIKHYLRNSNTWHLDTSFNFSGKWYLSEYLDVQSAKINPLCHFLKYGMAEGRLPNRNLALAYDFHLWAGCEDIMLPKLDSLLHKSEENLAQSCYAAWALCRWNKWQQDYLEALFYIELFVKLGAHFPEHQGPFLAYVDLLNRLGRLADSALISSKYARKFKDNDFYLLNANRIKLESEKECDQITNTEWLACINSTFEQNSILPISIKKNSQSITLSNITCVGTVAPNTSIWVSVIVPVFNGGAFITRALDCLLNQTWPNLDVIVVNDASNDDTSTKVKNWINNNSEKDDSKRFRLISHSENLGAYNARNTGVENSIGDLITIHDADDWSHPQKIEFQAQGIFDKGVLCSLSHWVRCTEDMLFERWRSEDSLTYRNISSLMIKREVFNKLGFWDTVRFGGDTEYYYRIISCFGIDKVIEVKAGVPLSFGLADPNSLTQEKSSHLKSGFYGVRKDYLDSARGWHKRSAPNLYFKKSSSERPFPVPEELLRAPSAHNGIIECVADRIKYSGCWDSRWYLKRYKHLQGMRLDPLSHFVTEGFDLNYDPSPNLNILCYESNCNKKVNINELSLVDNMFQAISNDASLAPPIFKGSNKNKHAKTVLLVGHASDKQLYGAERSLTDIARALSILNFNVVVSLPSYENHKYIRLLEPYSTHICIVNDAWWQKGISPCEEIIVRFKHLLKYFNVDVVHVNTLVQHNIYSAAAELNVPVVTHVRELLSADDNLLETMCSNASEAYERVVSSSEVVITNSLHMKMDIERNINNDNVK